MPGYLFSWQETTYPSLPDFARYEDTVRCALDRQRLKLSHNDTLWPPFIMGSNSLFQLRTNRLLSLSAACVTWGNILLSYKA